MDEGRKFRCDALNLVLDFLGTYVQHITRRIAALLAFEPRLDASYDTVKDAL